MTAVELHALTAAAPGVILFLPSGAWLKLAGEALMVPTGVNVSIVGGADATIDAGGLSRVLEFGGVLPRRSVRLTNGRTGAGQSLWYSVGTLSSTKLEFLVGVHTLREVFTHWCSHRRGLKTTPMTVSARWAQPKPTGSPHPDPRDRIAL